MHQHAALPCHHHTTVPAPQSATKIRLLWIALSLICGLSIAELTIGYWSHSLALRAEAGHMIADGLAIGLALLAAWLAQRQTLDTQSQQIETIAALLNGFGLVLIAGWISWEAIERFQTPPTEIASLPMLLTAVLGVGVNSVNVSLLHRDSHTDLNLRGVFLHVLADAISSLGVLVAAIVVATWQWLWADGLVSLFVAGLILLSAVPLIAASWKRLAGLPRRS